LHGTIADTPIDFNQNNGTITLNTGYGFNGGSYTVEAVYTDPDTNEPYTQFFAIYVQPCYGQLSYDNSTLDVNHLQASPTFKIGDYLVPSGQGN
jgi:hypothetical protein